MGRYWADSLALALVSSFALVEAVREEHGTPSGVIQHFQWGRV